MVTIFANIFAKDPHYLTVDQALERIKSGRSKGKVEEIRACLDKDRANELKKNLPCVCFSGKFEGGRHDDNLVKHSGFIVLDFDDIEDPPQKRTELAQVAFCYAAWVSPSGKGVKALVRVAKPEKHREHFEAIRDVFPDIDKSGVNVSRVCYESYDPEIYVNPSAKVFTTIKETVTERVAGKVESEIFNKILKWLTNRGDAFRTGERNLFVFKLASACCRFGMPETECEQNFASAFLAGHSDFSRKEAQDTIKKAYKASAFGTAVFEKDTLVTRTTKKEVEIDESVYDLTVRPKDVIFGEDVKKEAINIFINGYESAHSTFIEDLDRHFKWKVGEISLLSGIGNYGKSSFLKYLILLQVIGAGRKWAIFGPEDMPAEEFYHDLVETYLGCGCTPGYLNRPTLQTYEAVYDYISKYVFMVYPKTISPTPEYIKERFLELTIKEGIFGCVIDPFNQLANDYGSAGGRDDKYLETVLSDFARFGATNRLCFVVVAHPTKLQKPKDALNYPEPDVFDIAGGAMWNNKMDNILIYHRPDLGENPESDLCRYTSKKIRRQKIVGLRGSFDFRYDRRSRRYLFNLCGDPMEKLIALSYGQMQANEDFLNEKAPY